jgi:hypothetical protein
LRGLATSNVLQLKWTVFDMADSLYLSLWFPNFEVEDIGPRVAAVLRQFPYSATQQGITYISVQPLSWAEPSIFEQRFVPAATPEEAIESIQEFIHDDYAIVFEAYWDLWAPVEEPTSEDEAWTLRPIRVQFSSFGKQFEEGIYTEDGHVMINFGLDTSFLFENVELDEDTEQRVKRNIAKLVDFTQRLEQNCNLSGRVLWSESDENLAQKLIARLQQVQ